MLPQGWKQKTLKDLISLTNGDVLVQHTFT